MLNRNQKHYANVGHLPAIQVSKQEQKLLPVTCGPVGAQPEAIFKDEVVPFPARDLIIIYTVRRQPTAASVSAETRIAV
jgi:serine phosphatase RsbU (regulator of sigma subunit)